MNDNKGLVSVIIPTFNNEKYLAVCLDSILTQTYRNFEIIVYNDGSEDDSAFLLENYAKKYDCIQVYNIENHGQGYCRNRALEKARGEYVLFVDSDDFIESITLENVVRRMEEDQSDAAAFDFKYYKKNVYTYSNVDEVFQYKYLEGRDCLKLLSMKNFFSVTKMYRKQFLDENDIRYGEQYIYEDWPFIVKVAVKAEKISLIHSPLYSVRVTTSSSTKTNYDTDFHATSFIRSTQECLNTLKGIDNSDNCLYDFYSYLIDRFWLYHNSRVPEKYQPRMMQEFVAAMKDTWLGSTEDASPLVKYYYEHDIFKKQDVAGFRSRYLRLDKEAKQASEREEKNKKRKEKWNSGLGRFIKTEEEKPAYWEIYNPKTTRQRNVILFLGFDNRFTGNSRYLFEQTIQMRKDDIFFVTAERGVHPNYKVEPESERFYDLLARARIVVFESWIPQRYIKASNAIWIQLWHGTPIKKMLYDSNEGEITSVNPRHKNTKYKDLYRWTYLVTDNKNVNHLFTSAFLVPERKFLPVGYPRVKYLVDNKDNEEWKEKIKRKAHLPLDKKIVAYLPTWRDYNYGLPDEEQDTGYVIDLEKLKSLLPDDYYLVSKNHTYNVEESTIDNTDMETQELLLVADYLISDFSSVVFDAFAIDLPVVLYVNDFEKYQQSRGVYDELWQYLADLAVDTEEQVAERIQNYTYVDSYKILKEKYSYKNSMGESLAEILVEMAKHWAKILRTTLVFESIYDIGADTFEKIRIGDESLNLGKRAENKLIVGITNTTKDNDRFKKIKASMEGLSEIYDVIPIEGDKPTADILEKFHVNTVFTTRDDTTDYPCQVEYYEEYSAD